MKIIKESKENLFPYIAYIPDNISASPALIIQLHGAGERGEGGDFRARTVSREGLPGLRGTELTEGNGLGQGVSGGALGR